MLSLLLRLFGKRVVHSQSGEGRALDARLGFALLRDRRVPLRFKLLALGLGAAIMALLIALELPMEALWGVVLPFLGIGLDAMFDGVEGVVGPILLGVLLLPHLAPKPLVAQIRSEQAGFTPIDNENLIPS